MTIPQITNQGEPDVFISFAFADGEPIAREYAERQRPRGVANWLEQNEMVGSELWQRQILESLDQAHMLLLGFIATLSLCRRCTVIPVGFPVPPVAGCLGRGLWYFMNIGCRLVSGHGPFCW